MSKGRKTHGVLENISIVNLGRLIEKLIDPARRLSAAEKALADDVMEEITS